MSSELTQPYARPLEGPGAQARLQALRLRFQAAERRRKPLGFPAVVALSLAAFCATLLGGLWLLG